jgi:hypothetical protein
MPGLPTASAKAASGRAASSLTVVLQVAVAAAGFRAFSAVLAFLANIVIPKNTAEGVSVFGGTRAFWDLFVRWDSGWYFQIARYGYEYVKDGRGTIAYFPAYPLLMRYVGRLFGTSQADVYFGGILVSWVAFVVAMVTLYKLAALDLPEDESRRAPLLAAIFPFAFFFGVVYTESLFLAATLGAFYFFRTRRWLLGGLCGALATATRVNGVMMLPALAWIVVAEVGLKGATAGAGRKGGKGSEWVTALAGLLLVGAGIGAYSLYIYHLSGNPLEWKDTLERWGYYPGGAPWVPLVRLVRELVSRPIVYLATVPQAPYDTLNGLAALTVAVSVPFVWWRLGTAYGLYMIANLWLPLSSGQYEGLGRYCAVMFPFFIWLGSVRSRSVTTSSVVVFAALYALCMTLFTNLHPLF